MAFLGIPAATMTAISTGAQIAGTALSAIGALRSGAAASAQAKSQAAVLAQQAAREREVAGTEEADFRRRQSYLMASRRALMGGTGVEPGDGSPLLVSEDLAGEIELQALRIRSAGETAATRLTQQSGLERARGRAARSEGFFRAGSLLLQGGGRVFGQEALNLNAAVPSRRPPGGYQPRLRYG